MENVEIEESSPEGSTVEEVVLDEDIQEDQDNMVGGDLPKGTTEQAQIDRLLEIAKGQEKSPMEMAR